MPQEASAHMWLSQGLCVVFCTLLRTDEEILGVPSVAKPLAEFWLLGKLINCKSQVNNFDK